MMAYCEACGCRREITQTGERMEHMTIDGTEIRAMQRYGTCPACGSTLYTNEMIDYNVSEAHDAYRAAIGSYPVRDIERLLKRYNIGKQPLSKLLGWGANTIAREMRHTVPDREHTRRLRELEDPREMLELLRLHRNRISDTARRKAEKAALKEIRKQTEYLERAIEDRGYTQVTMQEANSAIGTGKAQIFAEVEWVSGNPAAEGFRDMSIEFEAA